MKKKKKKTEGILKRALLLVLPALNDFYPIHKLQVLLSGLNLGHDHSSSRCVKLEAERMKVKTHHKT